ncbi:MAG: PadR family transcriptional regulator [Longimicrobiales bacterium]
MFDESQDLPRGTLDLLILKVLSLEPMHGWGVIKRIQLLSEDVFQVNQGSLYPALQRLKRRGWVRSEWNRTENNRRARYYALTRRGEERLRKESMAWSRAASAVDRILHAVN